MNLIIGLVSDCGGMRSDRVLNIAFKCWQAASRVMGGAGGGRHEV